MTETPGNGGDSRRHDEEVEREIAGAAELAESEASGVNAKLLKNALAGCGIGTWEVDLRRRTIALDSQDARLLGLGEHAQVLALSEFSPLIHPEDRQRVSREYEGARAAHKQFEIESRFLRPDGEVRWLLGRGIFLRDDDGQSTGMVGVHVDVTDQHQVEEELRESRRRLSTLLGNLPGMAYRCKNNPHWSMLFVSQGAEALCGHPADKLVSGEVQWDDLVCPDDRHWLWEQVQSAVQDRRPFEVEYRIRHTDGRLRWVWEQGCGVFEHGEMVAVEGFITDITARKEAEEELRSGDRRKDQFLAMLGHELRNPLTAITSAAEFLNEVDHQDAMIARIEGVLVRQSRQMRRLIDGLLDVSRITRGKIQLEKADVELSALLGDLLADRVDLLERRDVEVVLGGQQMWVHADPVRISQVFDNLLTNAIKFTDEPDKVTIEIKRSDDHAEIAFRDTGRGIDEDLLPHIFEPFQQAEQDIARTSGGLGLGLALAKGLVELHDGSIEARSPGLGQGAEFRVCLPLIEPPDDARQPDAAPERSAREVLLVEDDPDVADVLTLLLERAGQSVRVASSATEGLTMAAQKLPDLVICDLGLPGMSGYDFARAVRAEPSLSELPLVALSGYGGADVRRRALDAGFDDHLTKPASMEQLAAVCATAGADEQS